MIEVARGTVVAVELVDPLSTGKNKTGDTFRARINEGVWVKGRVAVPPGSTVRGAVTQAVPSGRIRGRSRLTLTLQSLELDGRSYALHTDTLSYVGEPHTGQHLGSWLGGALQGALYGVLFGGTEGAVIGAGAGAAAGTGASVLKGKLDVEFPQGAKLMFEVTDPALVPAGLPAPQAPPPAQEAKPDAAPSKEAPKPEARPAT